MKGMSSMHHMYTGPYFVNTPMQNPANMYNPYIMYPCPYLFNTPMYSPDFSTQCPSQYIPYTCNEEGGFIELKDYGPDPFVVDIKKATLQNTTYRTALWTGCHLQLTLMCLNVGEDIGLEVHPELDQFIRIEEGQGVVMMGDSKCNLDFQRQVCDDYVFIIPAGKWHNLVNTGNKPLKLYSIYAPPQHPHGTVHKTKAIAQAAEESHGH